MGDSFHKNSPPTVEHEEDVTPVFREQVRTILEANKLINRANRIKKGAAGYLPASQAELADAADLDKSQLRRMLGPAKRGPIPSDFRWIDRSVYVGRIRKVLKISTGVAITVPQDRVEEMRLIAGLSDADFAQFVLALREIRGNR